MSRVFIWRTFTKCIGKLRQTVKFIIDTWTSCGPYETEIFRKTNSIFLRLSSGPIPHVFDTIVRQSWKFFVADFYWNTLWLFYDEILFSNRTENGQGEIDAILNHFPELSCWASPNRLQWGRAYFSSCQRFSVWQGLLSLWKRSERFDSSSEFSLLERNFNVILLNDRKKGGNAMLVSRSSVRHAQLSNKPTPSEFWVRLDHCYAVLVCITNEICL